MTSAFIFSISFLLYFLLTPHPLAHSNSLESNPTQHKTLNCSFLTKSIEDKKTNEELKLFFKLKKVQNCNYHDIPFHVPFWLEKEKVKAFIKKETKSKRKKNLYLILSQLEDKKTLKIKWIKKALDIQEDKKTRKKLYNLSPRLNRNPTLKEYESVALDYYHNLETEKAQKYYKKILLSSRSSFSMKKRAYHGLYKVFKTAQKKDKAIFWLLRKKNYLKYYFFKNKSHSYFRKIYYKALLDLGVNYWNINKIKKARWYLNKVIKSDLDFLSTKAYYIIGLIEEEKQLPTRSLYYFQKALDKNSISKKLKEKILWKTAWILKRLKKYSHALIVLKNLQNEFEGEKYVYWSGVLNEKIKNKKQAKIMYRKLINLSPYSYYGLLAHKKIKVHIKKPKKHFIGLKRVFLPPLTKKQKKSLETLTKLYEFNEIELMDNYLKHLKDHSLWHQFLLYKGSKNYLKAFYIYKKLDDFKSHYIYFKKPQWIYPKLFKKIIDHFSKKQDIEKNFIYALMRQESGFYPKAVSFMKAYGLMQILPHKANEISRKYNLRLVKKEDLFDPKINIKRGTYLLKELLNKYQNSYVLASLLIQRGRGENFLLVKKILQREYGRFY